MKILRSWCFALVSASACSSAPVEARTERTLVDMAGPVRMDGYSVDSYCDGEDIQWFSSDEVIPLIRDLRPTLSGLVSTECLSAASCQGVQRAYDGEWPTYTRFWGAHENGLCEFYAEEWTFKDEGEPNKMKLSVRFLHGPQVPAGDPSACTEEAAKLAVTRENACRTYTEFKVESLRTNA